MMKWHLLRRLLWIIPLISSTFIVVYTSQLIITVSALIVVAIVTVLYIHYEKLAEEQRYLQRIHELKQSHLVALSHQRHDAMNDIQVLLGYIKLDKKDKSIEYVDKIKTRAQNESAISKLNDYKLYHYINEMKLCSTKLTFEVEVSADTIKWNEQYSDFLIAVLTCYEVYDIHGKEKEAQLAICVVLDEQLHIQIEYNGQLSDSSAWKRDVEAEANKRGSDDRIILTIDEQDINITFLA